MKTYSEEKNRPAFDWNKNLDALIAGEEMSLEKLKELDDISGSWVTCACGNQCAIIPRNKAVGYPLDKKLHELGLDFCLEICDSEWTAAKEILKKIEARSDILIKELLNEKN